MSMQTGTVTFTVDALCNPANRHFKPLRNPNTCTRDAGNDLLSFENMQAQAVRPSLARKCLHYNRRCCCSERILLHRYGLKERARIDLRKTCYQRGKR
mmetsp:Transcript_16713/g.25994  ORF Transcript_16713/g.25994 Transcript_16713/m.25994 type:complete len:98 (-) Transcript_16713:157-450(-)